MIPRRNPVDPPVLFITGATGFIGRHVLTELRSGPFRRIYCLSRCPRPASQPSYPGITWVAGDVLDSSCYAGPLSESNVVLHMAATTGKASRREYQRTNVEGVRVLSEACRRVGVERLIHISTIAVKYCHYLQHYAYALSKRQAEDIVRNSGVNYTVVRPTIILAADSPAYRGLARLALGPRILLVGDGSALIQPIVLADLVQCMAALTAENPGPDQVIEVGGPEILSVRSLLTEIRLASGKAEAPVLRIPPGPFVTAIGVLEKLLFPWMPVTAGQLTPLVNPAVADSHPFVTGRLGGMMQVKDALRLCVLQEHSA